jgi:hypothetical protein
MVTATLFDSIVLHSGFLTGQNYYLINSVVVVNSHMCSKYFQWMLSADF